jgi:imidazolonepropionase-like amidohydrolase
LLILAAEADDVFDRVVLVNALTKMEEPVNFGNLIFLIPLVFLGACMIDPGNKQPSVKEGIYAIKSVSVVDVENGIVIPMQTVVVLDGRIAQIGRSGTVNIPQGATVIDGQGLYLMPGLVDAHVHYFDAPIFGRLLLANGVVLVRDMGMPNDDILPLRDALNQGEILGPEMVATGFILDGEPPLIPQISLGIKTPEDARLVVRQQVGAGVDMIKVYSTLDRDVFLTIMDEAQKHGLKVVGHVPDSIDIEEAADAGLDSMEHWFGFEKVIARLLGEPVKLAFSGMGSQADYLTHLDEVDPSALQDVYQRLRDSGLTVVPTVVTFRNYPDLDTLDFGTIEGYEYLSPAVIAYWKAQMAGQDKMDQGVWQNWAEIVRGLNQAGVPLMVGTDLMVPGIIPGIAIHTEMLIWQEVGIPAVDILRSATLIPAQFMGLGHRLGSIDEGKTASMVLVQGNPLDDIRNARKIEGVFLRGKYFNRQDLDSLLSEAKDLAQNTLP